MSTTSLHPEDIVMRPAKSRSPSIIIEDDPPDLFATDTQRARSRSQSVSREFTRARSGSVFSAKGDEGPAVKRGGIATSKALFAREVDMRKSAKEKPKPVLAKVKQKTLEPPAPAPASNKRSFCELLVAFGICTGSLNHDWLPQHAR